MFLVSLLGLDPQPSSQVRAVGTWRTQRPWSWVVLEGFLEGEEEEVEDGGLGVGALGRDFTARRVFCIWCQGQVGWNREGTQLGRRLVWIQEPREVVGRACEGQIGRRTPACRYWGTVKGCMREQPSRSWASKREDESQEANSIRRMVLEPGAWSLADARVVCSAGSGT